MPSQHARRRARFRHQRLTAAPVRALLEHRRIDGSGPSGRGWRAKVRLADALPTTAWGSRVLSARMCLPPLGLSGPARREAMTVMTEELTEEQLELTARVHRPGGRPRGLRGAGRAVRAVGVHHRAAAAERPGRGSGTGPGGVRAACARLGSCASRPASAAGWR